MATNEEEWLEYVFTYRPPDEDQVAVYETLRTAAKEYAATILRLAPKCADQSAAIRLVRESLMTANAAVALKGRI